MKIIIIVLFVLLNRAYSIDKMSFADDLILQGDLFRALTIYKELEFNSRGSSVGFKMQKRIIEIHLESHEFEGLDLQLNQLFKNYSNYIKSYSRDEIQAETFFLIGNHSKAFDDIYKLNASLEKKYLFRAYAESDQKLIDCNNPTCETIKNIEKDILSAKTKKNEYLALGLGIIPGMGQIYAGNPGSGIATFVLNSFFIATSVIAFRNDETAMGIASSVIGGTFYFSSIYAGYETARRYNAGSSQNSKRKLASVPIKLELIKIIFE